MRWSRFLAYSGFGWVVPVLLIASFFNLDPSFNPRHHLRNCWFSEARHILTFVMAPLCTIMTLNVVFFSWSAYLVYSTKSKMENRSNARTDLCLFVRLAVMMGITWTTGIVAGLLDLAGNVHKQYASQGRCALPRLNAICSWTLTEVSVL
jgi:cellobiose-specific phosphotransferase system component IIC